MNVALRRIRWGAILLAVILAASVCGYRLLGRSWLDALYMVVITVATVGFGEHTDLPPAEQVLTIAVILFGISAWVYTVGGFLQWMTEGELEKALGARRMTSEIHHLQQHVIVCGFGRMGQMLAHDLRCAKQRFVIIENDPQRVILAESLEYLVYSGDATEEDVLTAVGIERAKTLVVALPNDAASVFITLTVRNLNRDLQIIARGEQPSTQKKLVQAGADRVVLPATIGAAHRGDDHAPLDRRSAGIGRRPEDVGRGNQRMCGTGCQPARRPHGRSGRIPPPPSVVGGGGAPVQR